MINTFRGKYIFLSNFYPVRIDYDGFTYDSVEHAYHAQKINNKEWKEYCAARGRSAGDIKRFVKNLSIRSDWECVKVYIMEELLTIKFQDKTIQKLLLDTGDEWIIEENYWGDKFWGVCTKTKAGQNILGKLLMNIRSKIKNENHE